VGASPFCQSKQGSLAPIKMLLVHQLSDSPTRTAGISKEHFRFTKKV